MGRKRPPRLMGDWRNEANFGDREFGFGGLFGFGKPDQGVRRRRGRLPHWLRGFRNEANFGGSGWSGGSYRGWEWREIGAKRVDSGAGVSEFLFGGSGGWRVGGEAGFLECLNLGEGCLVGFFEEGDAAVQSHEDGAGVVEAFAEGGAVAAGRGGGATIRCGAGYRRESALRATGAKSG